MEPVVVDGGKGTVELRPDGVIHLMWETSVRIDVQDAEAAMAAVNQVAGDRTYPMLVDMGAAETVTRAARSVFSTPCAASRIALLGASPVDRMIANFFLGVYPQPCPTRFFTSRTESMKWLQKVD